MDTFDGERHKRNTKGNDQRDGYRAYVSSGGAGNASDGGAVNPKNDSIVMTTQVAVHSHGEWSARHSERDLESIDARSGVTAESVEAAIDDENRISSSSQVQLAKVGF